MLVVSRLLRTVKNQVGVTPLSFSPLSDASAVLSVLSNMERCRLKSRGLKGRNAAHDDITAGARDRINVIATGTAPTQSNRVLETPSTAGAHLRGPELKERDNDSGVVYHAAASPPSGNAENFSSSCQRYQTSWIDQTYATAPSADNSTVTTTTLCSNQNRFTPRPSSADLDTESQSNPPHSPPNSPPLGSEAAGPQRSPEGEEERGEACGCGSGQETPEETGRCGGAEQALEQKGNEWKQTEQRSKETRDCKERGPRAKPVRQNTYAKGQQDARPADPSLPGPCGTLSESAICGQEIIWGERLFYGAHVGSETRNVEFKRGGGEYLRSAFRSHLRRYACAFLNSGGGSLLVGVDDEGVVRGLRCDHRQEDRTRLLADSILKGFHPPLLPQNYSLAFVPVVRPGPDGLHLKVLRVTLTPPAAACLACLYQTDLGEVFLRRDGSVEGPLGSSAIQVWARQRWSGEVVRLQHCVEVLLTEQKLLLQEIQRQVSAIGALRETHTHSHTRSHKHSHTQTPVQAGSQKPSVPVNDKLHSFQSSPTLPVAPVESVDSDGPDGSRAAALGTRSPVLPPQRNRDTPSDLSLAGAPARGPGPLHRMQAVDSGPKNVPVSNACVVM